MKFIGKTLVTLAMTVAMTLTAFTAFAAYPSKPVTVVVPYGPGGDSDLATRIWADAMEKELGVPFVVVNKAGGSGVVGTAFGARAKNDGYTLMNAGLGNMLIAPNFSNAPYTFDSFEPVVKMTAVPFGIVVPAKSKFASFQDLIDAAKAKPNRLTMGSWGAASSGTIMAEIVANKLGYKPKYVQASGGALSMVSLVGGHIQSAVSFPPIFGPHVESGKARLLVLNSKMDKFPGVPTFSDYGVEGGFEGFAGVFAPKGVDPEIKRVLVEASKKVMKQPKVLQAYKNMNAVVDFRYGDKWVAEMRKTSDSFKEAAKFMKK